MMYVSRVKIKHCDWATKNTRQLDLWGIPWYFGHKYELLKVDRNKIQARNPNCRRTEVSYFAKINQFFLE